MPNEIIDLILYLLLNQIPSGHCQFLSFMSIPSILCHLQVQRSEPLILQLAVGLYAQPGIRVCSTQIIYKNNAFERLEKLIKCNICKDRFTRLDKVTTIKPRSSPQIDTLMSIFELAEINIREKYTWQNFIFVWCMIWSYHLTCPEMTIFPPVCVNVFISFCKRVHSWRYTDFPTVWPCSIVQSFSDQRSLF